MRNIFSASCHHRNTISICDHFDFSWIRLLVLAADRLGSYDLAYARSHAFANILTGLIVPTIFDPRFVVAFFADSGRYRIHCAVPSRIPWLHNILVGSPKSVRAFFRLPMSIVHLLYMIAFHSAAISFRQTFLVTAAWSDQFQHTAGNR